MLKYILLYTLIMNALGFLSMGIDKARARKEKWRIREKTLFLIALLGGSIGSFAGMWIFRHKTRHWYFVLGMPLIIILHLVMTGGLIYYGNDYYRAEKVVREDLKSDEKVTVTKLKDKTLVFEPEKYEKALIFYPGGKVEYTAYAPLMRNLAKEGILCIMPKMPHHLAVLDSDKADDVNELYPEVKEWFIGGHSLGGAMAATHVKKHPDECDGLILLGAYSVKNLKKTGVKVLSICGSEDGVLDREKYESNKKNLPEDMKEIVLDGGCHSFFARYGMQEGDGDPTITNTEQIYQTTREILKFMAK